MRRKLALSSLHHKYKPQADIFWRNCYTVDPSPGYTKLAEVTVYAFSLANDDRALWINLPSVFVVDIPYRKSRFFDAAADWTAWFRVGVSCKGVKLWGN